MYRRLLVLTAGLLAASGARAQADTRPTVYVEASRYHASGFYDSTGRTAIAPKGLTLTVGGEVPVLRRSTFTGTLGAALRFADHDAYRIDDDGEVTDDIWLESGFRPQHLDLYGRVAGDRLAATAGFVLDLGPEPFDFGSDDGGYFNSDAQHALHLGVSGERMAGPVRLTSALDGFLTFPFEYRSEVPYVEEGAPFPTDSIVVLTGSLDFGDTFVVQAGAGYPLGIAEVGLDVVCALTTGLEQEIDGGPSIPPDDGRYVLSLVPRVTFAPPGSRFRVEVAGRARGVFYGEHVPYGITLTGDHQPEVRFPISVGLSVAL